MSRTLTVELPDELYDAVERAARATGTPPAEWVAAEIRKAVPHLPEPARLDEIHEELLELYRQSAAEQGETVEQVAARWQAKFGPRPLPELTEEELQAAIERSLQAARERFQCHVGAIGSGDPNSADNERIDADLAREAGDGHEGGP